MYIYIDEAGNFAQVSTPHSRFDLVAALVIPESVHESVLQQFVTLRESWNGNTRVEIKGSKVTAEQARQVILLLADNDAVLEFIALDMATHSIATLNDFKIRTAEAIVENLTPEHHANTVTYLTGLQNRMERLSEQLFVQFKLTVEIVLKTLQHATLYYVQRDPRELGSFRWVVDQKERSLTDMEELWTQLIMPYGESHYARSNFGMLPNVDYSHFERFMVNRADPKWRAHLDFVRSSYGGPSSSGSFEAKLILSEHRDFADSQARPGLQLADIVATTLRRALNGRLEEHGWGEIGRLIIRRNTSSNNSMFVQLGQVRLSLRL